MVNENNISLIEIQTKWNNLHEDKISQKKLSPEIYESWQRSYKKGPSRFTKSFDNKSSASTLKSELEKSKHLIECALPVIENLICYLKNTGFVVVLTNSNLMILKMAGDKSAIEWANRANLIEGTIWTEDLVGTNTGSIVKNQKKPFSLFAYEHFCFPAIASTSAGCPIMESDRMLGGVGLVAPYTTTNHNYALGLATIAAKQIQSYVFISRIDKYQNAILNSMSDGVMVINLKGNVAFINQECLNILGFNSYNNVIGNNLCGLLGNLPENSYFISSITKNNIISDELFMITHGKSKIKCTVTCTPISNTDKYEQGNVIILQQAERSNHHIKQWFGRNAKMSFINIIGKDDNFRSVINFSKSAALTDSNVLLLGESGTGKDIIAQSMHNASIRKNNPFIAINCASLPRELLASELFGYEEGAFTGAKKGGNIGKFELANQGTLFLDEIGDVPMDLQVMLLRAIEEKSIIRLGDNKMTPVNIRIISATNKDLEKEIQKKTFRLDLFYRLGVIRLKIPPLRDRSDDVLLLSETIITNICKRYNKPLITLSKEVKQAFCDYLWPGNIRELQNVLESAVLLTESDEIRLQDISDYIKIIKNIEIQDNVDSSPPVLNDEDLIDAQSINLPDMEKRIIERHLKEGKYTVEEMSKLLGISRRTLYRRFKLYKQTKK